MTDDMVYKTFRAEVKNVDAETGSLDMFIPISTDSIDRDGELVEPMAFKKTLPKFMKRPILVASHEYRDLRKQIGEWQKLRITEHGVEGKPQWYINQGNEEADWGFNLASKGMAAISIGFIPKIWEDGDGDKSPRRTYKEVELLEISQVVVPSNRDAIQGLMAKGIQDPIVKDIASEVLNDFELITKPEETEDTIRIPVKGEEGKHKDHRIRTIDIDKSKGIKALYCGECKKVITYLFDKDKGWTMASAQEWVDEHSKSVDDIVGSTVNEPESLAIGWLLANPAIEKAPIEEIPEPKAISQEQLGDEVDFVLQAVKEVGLSEEQMPAALDLASEIILRAPGSDIPVDILSKVGTVLNDMNKERLSQIKQLAQEVFESANTTEEGEDQVTTPEPQPDPIKQRAQDVAAVADLVIAKLKGQRTPK